MPAKRAPRSDGLRNRQLILEAGARAFATYGHEATLNGIARNAGVGIGTLFRHFPTREALVETIYSDSLEYLCLAVGNLLRSHDSYEATWGWMRQFVDYMSLQKSMAETLRALAAADIDSRVRTVDRLTAVIERLLAAGHEEGIFREDVSASDVLVALSGIALMLGRPGQREQAYRLVDLLLAGLRPVSEVSGHSSSTQLEV